MEREEAWMRRSSLFIFEHVKNRGPVGWPVTASNWGCAGWKNLFNCLDVRASAESLLKLNLRYTFRKTNQVMDYLAKKTVPELFRLLHQPTKDLQVFCEQIIQGEFFCEDNALLIYMMI
ncbi:hypothetical protein M9H77_14080 [Catharanthus roseus]|uniref:Uncharacterized protein n=1 Tax=Catharanthus roseus TaxID=4058 RepID=A0ACC0BM54_CATRO|nr:hypothetical protein M9H77_14080 [Catharanthus roseus]